MGKNKALCQFIHHDTFLTSIVKTLNQCHVDNIVVVTGAQSHDVVQAHAHLNVRFAYNQNWQTTYMLESLVCGLNLTPVHSTVIHWPVDCVGIHHEDLSALIDAPDSPLAVLSWNNTPEHPMRISSQSADLLRNSYHQYKSLREFVDSQTCLPIKARHKALTNCNDPQILSDFLDRNS